MLLRLVPRFLDSCSTRACLYSGRAWDKWQAKGWSIRIATTYIIKLTKVAPWKSTSLLHSLANYSSKDWFSHPRISTDHHDGVLRTSVIQPVLNSVENPFTGAYLKSIHVILNISFEFRLGKIPKDFLFLVRYFSIKCYPYFLKTCLQVLIMFFMGADKFWQEVTQNLMTAMNRVISLLNKSCQQYHLKSLDSQTVSGWVIASTPSNC